MNTSHYTQQPQQLFNASMHAGGWPKLGWAQQDAHDELLDDDMVDGQQDN